MSKRRRSLYETNVVAPDEMEIGQGCRNERQIAAWYARVLTYARTMRSLDRVVMVCLDDDNGVLYLASVPETVP